MQMAKAAPPVRSFLGALKAMYDSTGKPALIAEVKKASPSKGIIQPNFDPVRACAPCFTSNHVCLATLLSSAGGEARFVRLRMVHGRRQTRALYTRRIDRAHVSKEAGKAGHMVVEKCRLLQSEARGRALKQQCMADEARHDICYHLD